MTLARTLSTVFLATFLLTPAAFAEEAQGPKFVQVPGAEYNAARMPEGQVAPAADAEGPRMPGGKLPPMSARDVELAARDLDPDYQAARSYRADYLREIMSGDKLEDADVSPFRQEELAFSKDSRLVCFDESVAAGNPVHPAIQVYADCMKDQLDARRALLFKRYNIAD